MTDKVDRPWTGYPVHSVKECPVLVCEVNRGSGTAPFVIRSVRQIWSTSGSLVAENDPCAHDIRRAGIDEFLAWIKTQVNSECYNDVVHHLLEVCVKYDI